MPSASPTPLARLSPTHLLLCLILLVAGFLRLARLDLMAFEMDEGAACLLAAKFTHYGIAPLVGIKTSLQFCNPPLFLYVISPALLVTTDPRFAAMLFALLGTAAVYVVYRTGREFFSPAVGLLAAAMMALSPAAIEYSRRLWGHSLIQALCPVAFYLLLQWTIAGRAKAVFWLALVVVVAQQFHFSAALLWVQIVLAWLLFRPRTDWVGLLCGLAVGLVGYLPFFIAQADTDFLDLRIIGEAIVHGTGQAWRFSVQPLLYWFFAATDLGHNNWFQEDFGLFAAQIPFYRVTRAIAGVAWIAGLLACGTGILPVMDSRTASVWHGHPARDKHGHPPEVGHAARVFRIFSPPASRLSPLLLLLTWSLVPLAVFLLLRVPVVAPYFLVVYPAPFLAIACLAVETWQRIALSSQTAVIRRGVQSLIVLLLAAWMVHQAAFNIALRLRLEHKGGGKGSYVCFGSQQAAMRFIALHAPNRIVLVTEEHMDASKGIDFRFWYLLWRFDHNMARFFPSDRKKAEYWYVIRNTNYRIRPDFDEFIARFPFEQFGPLRVYVIPRPGPWPRFGPAQPPPSP